MFTCSLPLDFYTTLPTKVDAVTSEDVERVSKQYFVPGKMFVVVVGDKSKVESGLQGLDMGKVQLTGFDGKPLSATSAGGAAQ